MAWILTASACRCEPEAIGPHMTPPNLLSPSPTAHPGNSVHPKKLLLTKWTAVKPVAKNKHFLVSKVMKPEPSSVTIEWVELEAVHSKAVRRMDWRELRDQNVWRQGWM